MFIIVPAWNLCRSKFHRLLLNGSRKIAKRRLLLCIYRTNKGEMGPSLQAYTLSLVDDGGEDRKRSYWECWKKKVLKRGVFYKKCL